MRIFQTLFCLCPLFLLPSLSQACSCAFFPNNFCETTFHHHIVVQVEVTDSLDYYLMEVKVLETLNKETHSDSLTIYGQDGLNCGEDLSLFDTGDTLILALSQYTDLQGDTLYSLFGCARHYLFYEDGMVIGPVNPDLENQSYDAFKADLSDCLDMINETDDQQAEDGLRLIPNPVVDELTIISDREPIQSIQVLDHSGKLVLDQAEPNLSFSGFAKGVYIVIIRRDDAVYYRRICKI